MKHFKGKILLAGLILTVVISNSCSLLKTGMEYDELRRNVLRLHILADSDSGRDQWLKLRVRDEVLRLSDSIFGGASSREEAEEKVNQNLQRLEERAEDTLRRLGCTAHVRAQLETVRFDERTYGDITMPAGDYRALRLMIGSAEGHNWWCVMYPELCLPAACAESGSADELFTKEQLEILRKPKKYRIRLAVWDKTRALRNKLTGKNDENRDDA